MTDPTERQDWKALDEELAARPVQVTHGEDGQPLPDVSGIELHHEPVEELDDELVLRRDGDGKQHGR